ncbi:putative glycosyl transferase [Gemmata sp. SH-PL17]|uniref:glycosyltransferase family 2 protein n=1 Tax=Gemmata sp. SH-PL17 TaxID=1630693 RepID=UPI00078E1DE7|nr:glycosyltransferase family 2 protein [Gemmata sp. SH-PL17]AMV27749.1 putative glycosyl transferase [Gemmata sp. SH-PL17]
MFGGSTPEHICTELVSCIMPTRNRRTFIPLATRAFLAQDYPNKELIVIDDGTDPVADLFASVPGTRYFRLPGAVTIGEKRNLACELARGTLIAQWDDDDWFATNRLSYQTEPLRAGNADITGLVTDRVLVLPEGTFWTIRPALHAHMFVGDVHGGTLVFRKSLFGKHVRYPTISAGEDAALLRAALDHGHRLRRLPNCGTFVYVRHSANAWRFDTGSYIAPNGWQRAERPDAFTHELLEHYRLAATSNA